MAIGYLSGDIRPLFLPIASGQTVAVGDLVAQSSSTLVRATDWTWQSAISTPTAPTVTNTSTAIGTSLTNAATNVKISYQFPWGEGTLSSAASATPTAGACLLVSGTSLVPPSPATYTNVYVETSAGSGVFKLFAITYGSSVLVDAYGAGQVPYALNPSGAVVSTGALQATQYSFAQAFQGVCGQYKALYTFFGAAATVPYGNSLALARIATSGCFYGDLASATSVSVGSYVAPAQDTGNDLLNQSLVVVSSRALAIGVVNLAGTSLTRVQFTPLVGLANFQPTGS